MRTWSVAGMLAAGLGGVGVVLRAYWSVWTSATAPLWRACKILEQTPLIVDDYRDLGHLAGDSFPIAENFEIEIFDDPSVEGRCLRFADHELGVTVEFPWWDDVEKDLQRWTVEDVPLGCIDEPFSDLEQGWRILVWRSRDYVFIMEGDDNSFHTWVRVSIDRYLSAWQEKLPPAS